MRYEVTRNNHNPELVELAGRSESSSALLTMATEGHHLVRAAVASNPRLTEQTQQLLALDANLAVRTALAHNASLSASVATVLLEDLSPAVRELALEHPEATVEWKSQNFVSSDDDRGALRAVRLACGPEELARQAGSSNPYVRRAVATHPSTDARTLMLLAHDDAVMVRLAVASRSSSAEPLPEPVASLLARDVSERVWRLAVLGK